MRNYRAIPIGGKDFVYGWYLENSHGQCFIVCTDVSSPPIHTTAVKSLTGSHDIVIIGAIEVIPSTVGQQVGLKDKNEKDAYAGDKVTICTYSSWVIDWHDAGWKLKQDWIDHWTEIPKDFIIIGTIHDK